MAGREPGAGEVEGLWEKLCGLHLGVTTSDLTDQLGLLNKVLDAAKARLKDVVHEYEASIPTSFDHDSPLSPPLGPLQQSGGHDSSKKLNTTKEEGDKAHHGEEVGEKQSKGQEGEDKERGEGEGEGGETVGPLRFLPIQQDNLKSSVELACVSTKVNSSGHLSPNQLSASGGRLSPGTRLSPTFGGSGRLTPPKSLTPPNAALNPQRALQFIQSLLESGSEEEALAEYLKLRAATGIFPKGIMGDDDDDEDEGRAPSTARTSKFKDGMKVVQRKLYECFLQTWENYDVPRSKATGLPLDLKQRQVLAAMLALAPRAEVFKAFSAKRKKELAAHMAVLGPLDCLQVPPGKEFRIMDVINAVRHVEVCYKLLLEAIEVDVPFLLGTGCFERSGGLLHPTAVAEIARLMCFTYFPTFQQQACRALNRINQASAKYTEESEVGFPVHFFEVYPHESELPSLEEEILVLLMTDPVYAETGEARLPELRWWKAVVVENKKLKPSRTGRKGLLSPNTPGTKAAADVWCEVLGDVDLPEKKKFPLRGHYYIRLSHRKGGKETFPVNRRVLLVDERGVYFREGEVTKENKGKYCVQIETKGAWVNETQLLPPPIWKMSTWKFMDPVLRSLMDLPQRVLRVLLDYADRNTLSHLNNYNDNSLLPMFREHDLHRELTVAWVSGLVEPLEDMSHHLLKDISTAFTSQFHHGQQQQQQQQDKNSGGGGGGSTTPTAYSAHMQQRSSLADWIQILSPVIATMSSFINLCLLGSQRNSHSYFSLASLTGERPNSADRERDRRPNQGFSSMPAQNKWELLGETSLVASTPLGRSGANGGLSSPPVMTPIGMAPADPRNPEDIPKRFATLIYNMVNAFFLELRHLCTGLRRAVQQYTYPSDMKYISCVLAFISFIRRAWTHTVHTLQLTTTIYDIEEVVTQVSFPILWRVTVLLDDFQSALLERAANLSIHWCRGYFFQDLNVQDWDSHKNFLQDRRISYGVQAWGLYLRGLMFDFKPALYQPSTGSEARELIANILARCLATLAAKYYAISPSRIRLPQYMSDLSCIVVHALTISNYLKSDPLISANGVEEGGQSGSHEATMSSSGSILESSLRPHDSSHQNALVSLQIVEHHCWGLLATIALLLSPPDIAIWYIRLVGMKTLEALEARGAHNHITANVAKVEDDRSKHKLKSIEESIRNIKIGPLVESTHVFMEVTEVFNPMVENQKIGADREMESQLSDESGGGNPESYVGKKTLECIELEWQGVLSTAPLMNRSQVLTIMTRRFELNWSNHPPLDEDTQVVADKLQHEVQILEAIQEADSMSSSSSSTSDGTPPSQKHHKDLGLGDTMDISNVVKLDSSGRRGRQGSSGSDDSDDTDVDSINDGDVLATL